jgi:hypothetical protein
MKSTIGCTRTRVVARAVILIFLALWGCEESLPPRNDPPKVLETTFGVLYPGDILIRDSLPPGLQGGFGANVKNVYTEVLQDTARVRMDVEVWLKDQPSVRATVHATEKDVSNGWSVLSYPMLTLGIDTAAIIQKQWSHRTDAGIPFWAYLDLSPGATMEGEPFCESSATQLVARATIQAFKNVQPVRIQETEFTLTYKVFGVHCPPHPPSTNEAAKE